MNKQYKEITMRRVCRASGVSVEVTGSIADWPPWAAKAVVTEVARWANDGFHFRGVDGVVAQRIGQDAGGHEIVVVAPILSNGPCSATAGNRWQTALEAVLQAQREG